MQREHCEHSDKWIELEGMAKRLHYSQASFGRHKCVYCAYLKGFEKGYKKAQQDAKTK